MNPKPTLKQRFFAETPDFFKKLHVIGLLLAGIATALGEAGVSTPLVTILASVGATITLISMFAVKDIAAIEKSDDPVKTAFELMPELRQQGEAVIRELKPIYSRDVPPAA